MLNPRKGPDRSRLWSSGVIVQSAFGAPQGSFDNNRRKSETCRSSCGKAAGTNRDAVDRSLIESTLARLASFRAFIVGLLFVAVD